MVIISRQSSRIYHSWLWRSAVAACLRIHLSVSLVLLTNVLLRRGRKRRGGERRRRKRCEPKRKKKEKKREPLRLDHGFAPQQNPSVRSDKDLHLYIHLFTLPYSTRSSALSSVVHSELSQTKSQRQICRIAQRSASHRVQSNTQSIRLGRPSSAASCPRCQSPFRPVHPHIKPPVVAVITLTQDGELSMRILR